jgi:hypothetical protein
VTHALVKAKANTTCALYRKRSPTSRPIHSRGGSSSIQPSPVPVLHLSPATATIAHALTQQPCSRAVLLGGRLTRLAVLAPYLPVLSFTLSDRIYAARPTHLTSHHHTLPHNTQLYPQRLPREGLIFHAHHARDDGCRALRDPDGRRRQEQEAEHGRAQAAAPHRTQPAPAGRPGATPDTRVRGRIRVRRAQRVTVVEGNNMANAHPQSHCIHG